MFGAFMNITIENIQKRITKQSAILFIVFMLLLNAGFIFGLSKFVFMHYNFSVSNFSATCILIISLLLFP
jgi:hypothetical protein